MLQQPRGEPSLNIDDYFDTFFDLTAFNFLSRDLVELLETEPPSFTLDVEMSSF